MSKRVSFDINCKYASINPNGNNSITVTIDECDEDDLISMVIGSVSLVDIMSQLDESEILDHIGVAKVKSYFDLTENE